MYGLVLMTALATGPSAPAYYPGGCYGGYGGYYAYGYNYGCYGRFMSSWSCYGSDYGVRYLGSGPSYPVFVPYQAAGPWGVGGIGAAPSDRGEEARPAQATGPAPATLVVHLPADAALTIGQTRTHSTSDTRTFLTPPLEPGKTYYYTLQAEVTRQGEKASGSRNVEVRAGEKTEAYLDIPVRKVPPEPLPGPRPGA